MAKEYDVDSATSVEAAQLRIVTTGTDARMGVVELAAGTATVTTTAVTANSAIFLTPQSLAGAAAVAVGVSARTPGTSFTITSADSGDVASVAWLIVDPAVSDDTP